MNIAYNISRPDLIGRCLSMLAQTDHSEPGGESLEHSLIREIARGDKESFKKLYTIYQRRLFAYLIRMLSEKQTAEEILNDVMFEVWRQAGSFKGKSRPSTWVFGIARNKALNALRTRSRKNVGLEAIEMLADSKAGPHELAESKDVQENIRLALGCLSPEQREVVELTFYHNFSYREIAEIMRCPVNTVKTRMFYAKQQLREILTGMGIGGY